MIKYGVPQGSILGPLLFIIYINDIPNISKLAKFILYADDANIIITGNSIGEINDYLNDLITKLVNWVNINGLALNLKKTNYMIFSRQRNIGNFNLVINKVPIELKSEARFLGVIIDDKLTFRKHISALKAKMSRYIGVMYKLKFLLPIKVRLLIYRSFIQSHLNFCSLVWGFAAKSFINELLTIQKKAIRAVMPGYVRYFYKDGVIPTHTKPAFNDYNILTVHNIIAKNTLLFMTKVTNIKGMLPTSIENLMPANAPNFNFKFREILMSPNKVPTCQNWLENYNSIIYRKSIFLKDLCYTSISSKNFKNKA